MSDLLIHTDYGFRDAVLETLRKGIAPHTLLLAEKKTPGLGGAQIAFGQPSFEAIRAAPELRWIQVTSAGYTRYDTREFHDYARGRGLILTNSSAVFAEPCAEHLLSCLLAGARHLPAALLSPPEADPVAWHRRRGDCRTLRGESVLLLGYGAIARELVRLLAPFEMPISAHRRKATGDEVVPIVNAEDLPSALGAADHVVNVLPDNAGTRHFVSAEKLRAMKPGATFYNIGRGTTVDQDALVTALRAGPLGAAWLDVTEPEPLPPTHPLWQLPNCFITPHTAGAHRQSSEHLVAHFLANFRRYLAGAKLEDRVI